MIQAGADKGGPRSMTRDEIEKGFRRMASQGTAPDQGCALFGVGYDDVFEALEREYLRRGFKLESSSEKFIVGNYGSGKTHFLRQLQEVARELTCVTSEVKLSKNVDFTKYISVFSEVVLQMRPPNSKRHGIEALLEGARMRILEKRGAGDDERNRELIRNWALENSDSEFESPAYGRGLKRALLALSERDFERLERLCRWLSGEFRNAQLCKELDLPKLEKADENRQAGAALLTLGQFNRRAHFRGTVIAFDEAEQGLDVDRRRFGIILSMLQSTINSVADLEGGALLICYAFTPEIVEKFNELPALHTRITSAKSFFEGNVFAPLIPLDRGRPAEEELPVIARNLAELFFSHFEVGDAEEQQKLMAACVSKAQEVARSNASITSRRSMTKAVCEILLNASRAAAPYEDEGEEDF